LSLSQFSSIAILAAIGETLNIMALGGLALAVGILVDVSRTSTAEATLQGAAGIALPTLVSTLANSAVFIFVEFLVGPPNASSRRWRWLSSLRCSPLMCCRAHSCRSSRACYCP
jgi:predicted ABC-type sugar transport system permease subunit